jgi:hypothetical protein
LLSVARFVSVKLGRFLPHGLADDAAVRSALLRRVWVFTFVDLAMRKG